MQAHGAALLETLGCAAALGSAFAWALGSLLFRRVGEEASPLGMNLGKALIGTLCLGLLAAASGGPYAMPLKTFLVLGLSGVLGIAVGDTFFFKSLICLNPRLAVLTGSLGPVFTVLMAVALLGERLTAMGIAGGALTLVGVAFVLWEGAPSGGGDGRGAGVLYGVISALCTAGSVILTKIGVAEVPASHAAFVRLAWGAAGLCLAGAVTRQFPAWLAPFRSAQLRGRILTAVLVVIFGGFYLSVVALKLVDASIATILNATEPLFVIPLAALALRERISLGGVAGALVAVAGVALLFLG